MVGREGEIVHRTGDVEIGIGIEPLDERAALMTEIALDLKLRLAEVVDQVRAVLQVAAELALQRRLGEIGDMRRHACDGAPALRLDSVARVLALSPVALGHAIGRESCMNRMVRGLEVSVE